MWRRLVAAVIICSLVGIASAAKKAVDTPLRVPVIGPNAVTSQPHSNYKGVTPNITTNTVDVYPQSGDLNTGSTDGSTFTDVCQMRAVEYEFGFGKFDLSPIPSGSYIWSVTANVYVVDTYWPWWCITKEIYDPLTTDAATLWNEIYNEYSGGTVYSWNYESSDFAPGWYAYDLGSNGASDLEAALSQGWFAIGVLDFDFSTTYYVILDGWCGNSPYLTVEYSSEPPPTPVPCEEASQCGPFPTDYWLADMAFIPDFFGAGQNALAQVEVDASGSDILFFNPTDCSYCEAYDDVTGTSQRAIAYDPGENVIYVGGWNSMGVFKFSLPACGDNLSTHYLGFCDLSATNFWGVSGLAWDDVDGGMYITNSADNQLGKFDFSTCSILWYCDITWMGVLGWSPIAAGLAFDPVHNGIWAPVFDGNTYALSNLEFFNRPEDDAGDECVADTFCTLPDGWLGWGVGQEDNLTCEAWVSEYYSTYYDYHMGFCPTTGVAEKNQPVTLTVLSAHPNPFTGSTEISFALPKDGKVNLSIYDASGRLVTTLLNSNLSAGTHTVVWNAQNMPAGIYFYKLTTADMSVTKKLVLMK